MTITDTAPNDVESAEEHRPRRRTPWMWAAGSATALVAGGWLLLGSPFLAVDSVEVVGYPGAPEVITEAAGISAGSSLLLLNPTTVAQRVSDLEDVATATVSRQWPDSVVIKVDPERTVAYSQAPDGVYLRGGTGGLVGVVGQPPSDLPAIGPMSEVQVDDALVLLGSLPPETLTEVARVDFSNDNGYVLTLVDGRGTVVWGQSQEAQLKSTVLAAMMRVDDSARWFDLTNPRAPRAAAAAPQEISGGDAGEQGAEPGARAPDAQGQGVDTQGAETEGADTETSGELSVGLRPAG